MAKRKRLQKDEVTEKKIRDVIENAWLNLGDFNDLKLGTPLTRRNQKEIEDGPLHYLRLMRNPDYFGFTAKHIFNKELTPMQIAILQELWKRPFPMLIGCRGFGKCITGDSLVMVQNRLLRIRELAENAAPMEKVYHQNTQILGENGFKKVEYAWNNGVGKTIKIETRSGYPLEGTPNHPIRVLRNGKLEWVELKDVKKGDRVPIERSEKWFEPEYEMDDSMAYLLGLLSGLAYYDTTSDTYIMKFAEEGPEEAARAILLAKYGIEVKPGTRFIIRNKEVIEGLGISPRRQDRDIPRLMLGAPKKAMKVFLQALADTCGHISKSHFRFFLMHQSRAFLATLQQLLLRFGVASFYRPGNKGFMNALILTGRSFRVFLQKVGFNRSYEKSSRQDTVLKKISRGGLEFFPNELVRDKAKELEQYHKFPYKTRIRKTYSFDVIHEMLKATKNKCRDKECWQYLRDVLEKNYYFDKVKSVSEGEAETFDVHVPEDHSFISNGFISHNSFLLGLYAMFRATLCQGSKVVIVGAGRRQARVIFDYCAQTWDTSPILRDMCGDSKKNGPRYGLDQLTMIIGESKILALPLGDGCLAGNTLLLSKDGWRRMGDGLPDEKTILPRQTFLQSEGQWKLSDEAYSNGLAPTKIIKSVHGYRLEGTHNHKVKVWDRHKLNIVWKRLDELKTQDYLVIDRSQKWHDGDNGLSQLEAYEMGKELRRGKCEGILDKLLGAKKQVVAAFLRGLLFSRGSFYHNYQLGHRRLNITVPDPDILFFVHQALLRFGIISCLNEFQSGFLRISLSGEEIQKFEERIGFGLRKDDLKFVIQKDIKINHDRILGIAPKCRELEAKYRLPTDKRITPLHSQGMDIGQVKAFIAAYEWTNEEFILSLKKIISDDIYFDRVYSIRDGKCLTYDCHVPDNHTYTANGIVVHNTKIRGIRATHLISDEFASIPVEIYQNVVEGFGAVSQDPVGNVKRVAAQRAMERLGISEQVTLGEIVKPNQSIISGTAYYSFNHFYDYWKRYKGIIESRGNPELMARATNGSIDPGLDWRDFSIIRVPVNLLPEGYMDAKVVAKAKATQHSSNFLCEFDATFVADSDGFFPRRLIEKCVSGKASNPINHPSAENIYFTPRLVGDKTKKYVMAIDPASERDNFAIVILECWPDHRRIVYVWTTNAKRHEEQRKQHLVAEHNFYQYVTRKIQDLVRIFSIERMAIDMQGGGRQVVANLGDVTHGRFRPGDEYLFPIIVEDDPKETDDMAGRHIIVPIQFAKADWVSSANHNLKKCFENKTLLFPAYDSAVMGLAMEEDKLSARKNLPKDGFDEAFTLFDTLEDAIREVEELKDELATIVHSQTSVSGREHWDTPEIKEPGGKKGRLRKDRYSALLMANAVALDLQIEMAHQQPEYIPLGGFAHELSRNKGKEVDKNVTGPLWYRDGWSNILDVI